MRHVFLVLTRHSCPSLLSHHSHLPAAAMHSCGLCRLGQLTSWTIVISGPLPSFPSSAPNVVRLDCSPHGHRGYQSMGSRQSYTSPWTRRRGTGHTQVVSQSCIPPSPLPRTIITVICITDIDVELPNAFSPMATADAVKARIGCQVLPWKSETQVSVMCILEDILSIEAVNDYDPRLTGLILNIVC